MKVAKSSEKYLNVEKVAKFSIIFKMIEKRAKIAKISKYIENENYIITWKVQKLEPRPFENHWKRQWNWRVERPGGQQSPRKWKKCKKDKICGKEQQKWKRAKKGKSVKSWKRWKMCKKGEKL